MNILAKQPTAITEIRNRNQQELDCTTSFKLPLTTPTDTSNAVC